MGSDPWAIAAAAGQVVAAIASVFGLFFVGAQIRASRKAADFKALQEFNQRTIERESLFLNAENDARKEQAFVEFLNFLEIYAAALNGKLLPSVSRKIVSDSITNSIAAIQMAPLWAVKFEDAVRTTTTFEELARFIRKNKRAINSVIEEMRRKFEPERTELVEIRG